jgi:hypothetical protein
MTLIAGLCCATDGSDDQQALADLSVPVVRVALTKAHSGVPVQHRMRGRQVIGVVCAETFNAFGYSILAGVDHHKALQLVQQRWGPLLAYVEIGNEPDDPGAASSGMPAETWAHLLQTACEVFHPTNHDTPQLISGGLSTGQPSYLSDVSIPPCNWFGMHAYNQRLHGWPSPTYGFGELEPHLDAYRLVWSKLRGIALTEWGVTDDTPAFASEYISRFLEIVRARDEVKLAAWFALSDKQAVSPHGLLRADGSRKPQFSTYAKEATVPEFNLGFKDYADAHPKIGKPLSDERYFSEEHDVSIQIAEGGVLYYAKASNAVVCTPTGDPGKA